MFEKSESVIAISKALIGFQSDVQKVKKTANNPFYKSMYAPLDAIIDAIKEPLKKHGLSYSQLPAGDGLTTILMHTSGEYLAATAKMELKDANPQGQGSAITYMRRYALSAVLGIATEEDDDGNAATAGGDSKTTKAKAGATGEAQDVGPGQNDSGKCPKCGGEMWDNRPKKATGEYSAKSPDFKCKDKNCDGATWPKKDKTVEDDDDLIAAQFAAEQEPS